MECVTLVGIQGLIVISRNVLMLIGLVNLMEGLSIFGLRATAIVSGVSQLAVRPLVWP